MRLSDIKSTDPKREHGSIEELKKSIAEVGLINPLTIDENGNLLAGRRRYQALMELYGPDYKPDVRILPINGDQLKAFKISIDENLKRKPLTDPEVAAAIKEYDELKRLLEGERQPGRPEIGHTVTDKSGWSLSKTANDLGISKSATIKAIRIATAIAEYPELAKKKKGQEILVEFQRKRRIKELMERETPRELLPDEIKDASVKCEEHVSPDGIRFKVYTQKTKNVFSMWDEVNPEDLGLIQALQWHMEDRPSS